MKTWKVELLVRILVDWTVIGEDVKEAKDNVIEYARKNGYDLPQDLQIEVYDCNVIENNK